jgi:CHC2 zinc finger/Toprim domain
MIDLAKSVRVEDEIARRGGLGLKRIGGELIGPCPQCGGRDRFAVSIRKQIFLCRGCGRSGDVIAFVQHVDNCDFKVAVVTLGGDDPRPIATTAVKPVHQETESDAQKTARALRIWNDEASEVAGTYAEVYLRRRGLALPDDDGALRYCYACPFNGTHYPALVALFRDIHSNEPRAIHRIAITAGGILIAKRMLGRVAGCAVKLDADENVELSLSIGEGIETMIAARMRGIRPAWAVGSAGALRNFPVLGGVEALTIIVDHDLPDRNGRQAGQEAAAECSQRWTAAGREVRRVVPRRQGADMADLVEVHRDGG